MLSRKFITLVSLFAIALLFAGCTKAAPAMTPLEVVKDFHKAGQNCDGAGMIKHVSADIIKDMAKNMRERGKADPKEFSRLGIEQKDLDVSDNELVTNFFSANFKYQKSQMEKAKKEFKVEVNITGEKIDEDGKKAKVNYTLPGDRKRSFSLVKVDGVWKFDKPPIL